MKNWSPRRRLVLAMVIVGVLSSAAALLALDARATYGARTTADEPQYLLSALSLGEDVDLDISDEIAGESYLPFHEVGLNQQTIPLNESGQRLSPHDPLLPAVLAIPMRVGGWTAAKATLAVLGGLTAAATLWAAVRRFGVGVGVGAAVVGACFLSPPLIAYGSQIYPEIPAALAVVVGLGAVTGSLRRWGLLIAVASIVALPWLAVKYTPLAAVLAAFVLIALWRSGDRRRAWIVGMGLAAAGALYLLVHQRIYGGWTVYAAGDHFVGGEFQVVGSNPSYWGRSRRLLGLLVDERFGLLAWAPVYLALIPGVAVLVATRERTEGANSEREAALALLVTGWAMATWVALTMHGWWWPGRQVVVILPVAVIAIAVLAHQFRVWFGFVLAAGLVGFTGWVWVVAEASTDRLTLIVDFFDTASPWYRAWSRLLPDHADPGAGDVLLTIAWAALIAALTVLTVRRLPTRSSWVDEHRQAVLTDARRRA